MILLDTHVWVWWVHKDPADQIIVATGRIHESSITLTSGSSMTHRFTIVDGG